MREARDSAQRAGVTQQAELAAARAAQTRDQLATAKAIEERDALEARLTAAASSAAKEHADALRVKEAVLSDVSAQLTQARQATQRAHDATAQANAARDAALRDAHGAREAREATREAEQTIARLEAALEELEQARREAQADAEAARSEASHREEMLTFVEKEVPTSLFPGRRPTANTQSHPSPSLMPPYRCVAILTLSHRSIRCARSSLKRSRVWWRRRGGGRARRTRSCVQRARRNRRRKRVRCARRAAWTMQRDGAEKLRVRSLGRGRSSSSWPSSSQLRPPRRQRRRCAVTHAHRSSCLLDTGLAMIEPIQGTGAIGQGRRVPLVASQEEKAKVEAEMRLVLKAMDAQRAAASRNMAQVPSGRAPPDHACDSFADCLHRARAQLQKVYEEFQGGFA